MCEKGSKRNSEDIRTINKIYSKDITVKFEHIFALGFKKFCCLTVALRDHSHVRF